MQLPSLMNIYILADTRQKTQDLGCLQPLKQLATKTRWEPTRSYSWFYSHPSPPTRCLSRFYLQNILRSWVHLLSFPLLFSLRKNHHFSYHRYCNNIVLVTLLSLLPFKIHYLHSTQTEPFKKQIKYKATKLAENNTGENLDDLEYGDDFSDTPPKACHMKEIIEKLDFIKIKRFCSIKDTVKRMRKQAFEEDMTYLIRTIIENIHRTLKIQ